MATSLRSRTFEMFRAAIDDVLDSPLPNRKVQAENFLKTLALGRIRLSEFEKVAYHLPAAGGPYSSSEPMSSTAELYLQLSSEEREDLRQYLHQKVDELKEDFPDFIERFKEQFS